MKTINVSIAFLAALAIDGFVLPGLLGFKEGMLALIFLVAMILTWGPNSRAVILGLIFTLFIEVFWQLEPGSLLLSFAVFILVAIFLFSTFTVKRNGGSTASSLFSPVIGLLMLAVFFVIFTVTGEFLYNTEGSLKELNIFNDLFMVVFILTGFSVCFIFFDFLCLKNNTKFL